MACVFRNDPIDRVWDRPPSVGLCGVDPMRFRLFSQLLAGSRARNASKHGHGHRRAWGGVACLSMGVVLGGCRVVFDMLYSSAVV